MADPLKPYQLVDYPSSDGQPMAENDINREDLTDAVQALSWWYREQSDVYVSGNLRIYYEQGNRRKHRAPDVFVVFGVEKKLRDNYQIWEEGKCPTVIIEICSETAVDEDTGPKKALYAEWGVSEYYLFDPKGLYLTPPLRGYNLINGGYDPMFGPPFRSASMNLDIFTEGIGCASGTW